MVGAMLYLCGSQATAGVSLAASVAHTVVEIESSPHVGEERARSCLELSNSLVLRDT